MTKYGPTKTMKVRTAEVALLLTCGHWTERVMPDRFEWLVERGYANCPICEQGMPIDQNQDLRSQRQKKADNREFFKAQAAAPRPERYETPRQRRYSDGLFVLELGPDLRRWRCKDCKEKHYPHKATTREDVYAQWDEHRRMHHGPMDLIARIIKDANR